MKRNFLLHTFIFSAYIFTGLPAETLQLSEDTIKREMDVLFRTLKEERSCKNLREIGILRILKSGDKVLDVQRD